MKAHLGPRAEGLAADYLRRRGYRIVTRNFRCVAGEIDIIAEDHGTLCFVEVKARSSLRFGFPSEAVNKAKQRRLARAASCYLAIHHAAAEPPCRFDVVALGPDEKPELIPDAFRSER